MRLTEEVGNVVLMRNKSNLTTDQKVLGLNPNAVTR